MSDGLIYSVEKDMFPTISKAIVINRLKKVKNREGKL